MREIDEKIINGPIAGSKASTTHFSFPQSNPTAKASTNQNRVMEAIIYSEGIKTNQAKWHFIILINGLS